MKRFFTFLFVCMGVFALKAQNGVMVADFDDAVPYDVGGLGIDISYDAAPDGSLASGQMLVVDVPANAEWQSFSITLNEPFDPRDYVGLSFVAEAPVNFPWVLKLEQTALPNDQAQIQDWDTWPSYTGEGEWKEVQIPFDVVLGSLGDKLAADPSFPADQYDIIELAPAAYQSLGEFTVNLDNFMLRTSFDETGTPLTKLAAFVITSANGNISATGVNGNPVSLKVYSISGQEIAEGVNQVQIGTKGTYIVKATNGNVSSVSKIIVK